MEVAELKATDTPDVMQPEDSVDAIIRQASGSESLLCFPRATENTEQWLQLLHVLDHQGCPLLCPLNLKFPLKKCDKCSQEFCSIVNYRRHLRVHNRFQKLDKKESKKTREALGAYWDKLSVEEAKEVVSFENAKLEDVAGSSILNALNTVVEKHGFYSIPLNYVIAGAALLDVLKSEPSSLPISSQDLFRILDETSEKTCFLGSAVSMQKYVFDGDAGKVCLELKNLVACASFLLEQNLTKAWIADKDAESLRCQNQLVEEETVAQKRQYEISKKKNKKKLRQNQQNSKEERHRDEVETKGNFESTVNTLSPEASLDAYDSETNNPEKFSSDSPSHVPSESAATDEGTDGINRYGYTFDTDQNIETQSEQGQSQWRIVQKKAREQRNKGGAEIKKNVDSTLKALSPAKVSLDTYKIGAHNLKKIANDAPSHVPSQHPDTNKGSDGDAQSWKDVATGIVQKKAREQRIKGGAEIKGNVDSSLKTLSPAKISLDKYKIGAHSPKKVANDTPSHVPSQHPDTNEASDGDAQSWKDVATGIVQKKAREQRINGGVEIKGNVDGTLKALSPAKLSLDTYKIGDHNPKKIANDAPSHVPSQHPDTNEGSDGDAQSWKDVATGIVQKKAREQRINGGAEIKGNVDGTLKALSPAKLSLDTYKIGDHNPKTIANDAHSHVPSQHPDTNEGSNGDAQSWKDVGTGIVQKKAREQRIKGGVEIKGNVDSTLKALSPAKISSGTYKIGAHNPKKIANDTPPHVPSQHTDTNEGSDGDAQSGKDVGIVQKAREQRIKGGAEIKGDVDSTLKALSPAKISSDTYKIGAHNPKKAANDAPSHVPSQNPETNEGSDGDTQSEKDVGTDIVQKTAIEQRIKGGEEIKENVDSTLKALSPAKISSDTYKIGAHDPEKIASGTPPHVPSQHPDTNEGSDGDAQSGKDVGTEQNIERQSEHGHNHGDVEGARGKGLPKSEPDVANDLNSNQNSKISKLEVFEKDGTQGDQSVAAIADGDKAKPKPEVNSVVLKTIAEKEPDQVKNYEVLIGSVSVNVGNCRKSCGNVVAARKDCMVGNVAKQNTSQDKPIKPELAESGTKQSTVKPEMPTSQLETKDPLPVQSGGTEVDAGYAIEDRQDLSGPGLRRAIFAIFKRSFISDLEGGTDPGSSPLPFYIEASNAFLVLRFKEAMSSDHVVSVVSNDSESEPSECKETQDMKIEACQSSSGAADSCDTPAYAENKSLPTKHRKKSGKGAKAKDTSKQKTDT